MYYLCNYVLRKLTKTENRALQRTNNKNYFWFLGAHKSVHLAVEWIGCDSENFFGVAFEQFLVSIFILMENEQESSSSK